MATIETFTFTTEQFLNLISVLVTLIIAVIGAAVWITIKVSRVEKDVENLLKNPYIKAVRDIEEKQAKESMEKLFGKTLNTWEAEKKATASDELGDESSKQ